VLNGKTGLFPGNYVEPCVWNDWYLDFYACLKISIHQTSAATVSVGTLICIEVKMLLC
jgi:hypothetical protein